eukprot:scaffold10105_cov129-Cylindrotheca_fusiformis.AAC.3
MPEDMSSSSTFEVASGHGDRETKQWAGNVATWSGFTYDDDGDDEDEMTLNRYDESVKGSQNIEREHSSETRNSYIPTLRELPSFGSTMTGSSRSSATPHYSSNNIKPTNKTPSYVSEESVVLLTENETKLPNINTIRRPIHPVLMQNY